ncbi:M20/M25/M40 family metallo-hydrolase [Acanthopleuribacter pedis]|uniref:M20/M25/M40 family metallo-hydrolase n=1 Tax=Acanthopleuribacter pedis TaxID=442870 RepID=A0A8J7QDQ6_9BACT|nr:M20/M25/M40 family metallo-hydrolase [Acanthopleuribacter pedis]MBO1322269.1 M20/M25/M40 family metallo-hydrolase [Acanthopleuribacter pedis]
MVAFDLNEARGFFDTRADWLHGRIDSYVRCQSPTAEPARCDAMAALIAADLAEIGLRTELPRVEDSAALVVGTLPDAPSPELVMVYHHDTVWPLDGFPNMRREGARWFAPGIYDMKAGIPLGIMAIHYIYTAFPDLGPRIRFLSSPDEETMGPVSRNLVRQWAAGAAYALVFEPPTAAGAFKQHRKGIGRCTIEFVGKATHAGNHYAEGKSALAAAARLLPVLEGETDLARGKTVNVGLLQGGSAVNTRPGYARMAVDVRIEEENQWQEVQDFLNAWRDERGVVLKMTYEPVIPPMHAEHEAWRHLAAVCEQQGIPFQLGKAGGASDGNFLAKAGLKVFDGLGVPGAGEHADHEHIQVDQLWPTFARNVALIRALLHQ